MLFLLCLRCACVCGRGMGVSKDVCEWVRECVGKESVCAHDRDWEREREGKRESERAREMEGERESVHVLVCLSVSVLCVYLCVCIFVCVHANVYGVACVCRVHAGHSTWHLLYMTPQMKNSASHGSMNYILWCWCTSVTEFSFSSSFHEKAPEQTTHKNGHTCTHTFFQSGIGPQRVLPRHGHEYSLCESACYSLWERDAQRSCARPNWLACVERWNFEALLSCQTWAISCKCVVYDARRVIYLVHTSSVGLRLVCYLKSVGLFNSFVINIMFRWGWVGYISNERGFSVESSLQRISSKFWLWKRNDSPVVLYTWSWRGKPAASARAGLRKGRALGKYFSEQICYMFLISKCKGDRGLGLCTTSVIAFGEPQRNGKIRFLLRQKTFFFSDFAIALRFSERKYRNWAQP